MVSWCKKGYTFNIAQHTFENLSPLTCLYRKSSEKATNHCTGSPHPLLVAEQFTCRDLNILELNDPVTQRENETDTLCPANATLQRRATLF